MIDIGIEKGKLDPKRILVCAEPMDAFAKIADEHLEGWYDVMTMNISEYDLGQIVFYDTGFWMGAFLWRRARSQSYPRDRWLGWHQSQQAERLPLVIECIAFQPRFHMHNLQPDYGNAAIKTAVSTLPKQWEKVFGYRPLLADTYLEAKRGFSWYFERNGWQRTTDQNPRVAPSHWVRELVPDAKSILTTKHLDKVYAGGPETNMDGILPIADELLSSFKDAFKRVFDPRENNRHYPLESVLTITLMALISGADSVNSILKFSTRLSGRQAQLLGLPCDESNRIYDLPAYHVYYRALNRVDFVLVAESLIDWLKEHMTSLPQVLHPSGDVIRDALLTLAQRFRHRPKPLVTDFELPIGVDPDAPDGIKRDA